MIKQFTVLDAWQAWAVPSVEAAERRGYDAKRITVGEEIAGRQGLAFIRPHAAPKKQRSLQDDRVMRGTPGVVMVQDRTQVDVFEDKGGQLARWAEFMPPTWRFNARPTALAFAAAADPHMVFVSKADEGASSSNIRILATPAALKAHINEVFMRGVRVRHCGGHMTMQRKYLMLQRYIPHTITWRVNVVGRKFAIFSRFNYPDKPVAQTGNVAPVMELTEQMHDLLDFASKVAAAIGTRWCALDILHDYTGDKPRWVLLETSLGWPWPSPGDCDSAPFFMFDDIWGPTTYKWRDMWELMLDEYEAGAFNA